MIFLPILNKLKTNSTLVTLLGLDWIGPNDNAWTTPMTTFASNGDIKAFPVIGNQMSTYPQIVIQSTAQPIDCHEDTSVNYEEYGMQIDVYSSKYTLADSYDNWITAVTNIKSTLDGVRNYTDSGINIHMIKYERQQEDFEKDDEVYRMILEFKVVTYAN